MSHQDSLGRLVACIHHHARSYIQKELEPFQLGSGGLPVLMTLLHHDGINQQELSEKLHVDKANTTRAVSKLIQQGYVRRERDPQDQRAYRLFVTKKAREDNMKIRQVLDDLTNILADGFTDEERAIAAALLRRMRNNVIRQKAEEQAEQ